MGFNSSTPPLSEIPHHRRNRSAAVLKSIILPKSNKKGQAPNEQNLQHTPQHRRAGMPLLPPDHPHVSGHRDNPQPSRPGDKNKENGPARPGLHKKTKSTTSLKGFGNDKVKDESKVLTEGNRENGSGKKPRKSKSSTSLATIFGKSKSGKSESSPKKSKEKDKENTSPPRSAEPQNHTPIWAQYSSQPFQEITTTTNVPLNDQSQMQKEIDLFTPKIYTPSKQRNFHNVQPVLATRNQRPKSEVIIGTERLGVSGPGMQFSGLTSPSAHRENANPTLTKAKKEHASDRRGSRVMNFVAQFNERAQRAAEPTPMSPQDLKKLETDFEAVLEKRQIPEATRDKMRTMNGEMKLKFIRAEAMPSTPTEPEPPQVPTKTETHAEGKKKHIRTRSGFSTHSNKGGKENVKEEDEKRPNSKDGSKKRRPRSRTFTFGKGESSPSKKQKAEGESWSKRSTNVPKSPSSTSLASVKSSASGKEKKPKTANPKEFVKYLRQAQRPQEAEVGKLHKLRLLIRNETVEWVDLFIGEGGMVEIVGLLHRIMKVEWREEHEDQLLHETLLCLKGLCTTALALQKLCDIEKELFPALLGMLFDEEHKGPSEFTTRTVIINIIFTHLSSAPASELETRARKLLGYLQDPTGPDDKQPLPFIMEMHKPRPYRVWCKEVVNVTKEVFWIFLHSLNTIPLPKCTDADAANDATKPTTIDQPPTTQSYNKRHFPSPRPPVPAAPYVGGVEWDATNYMAAHLDLLNGILASLPTTERTALRDALRASGWEKLMGQTLRTCKEKFYGAVHDGLRTWVAAAAEDGWDAYGVRTGKGAGQVERTPSPKKSPRKKREGEGEAPRVDFEAQRREGKFDIGLGLGLSLAEAHHKWRDAQREAGEI